MSATKKEFSYLEFQRKLGLKRYETAFNLMHKIRSVMRKRDELYFLKGMVEYDEAYVRKSTLKSNSVSNVAREAKTMQLLQ